MEAAVIDDMLDGLSGKTGCVDFTVDTVVKFSLFASCLDLWGIGNACFEFNPPHTTIVRAREFLTLLSLAQTTCLNVYREELTGLQSRKTKIDRENNS